MINKWKFYRFDIFLINYEIVFLVVLKIMLMEYRGCIIFVEMFFVCFGDVLCLSVCKFIEFRSFIKSLLCDYDEILMKECDDSDDNVFYDVKFKDFGYICL